MADDPDILVMLTSARTEFEGQTMASTLEADGIPAKVFATSANMLQWEAGYTDPIKVMVRRRDLAKAAASLKRTRRNRWTSTGQRSMSGWGRAMATRSARRAGRTGWGWMRWRRVRSAGSGR